MRSAVAPPRYDVRRPLLVALLTVVALVGAAATVVLAAPWREQAGTPDPGNAPRPVAGTLSAGPGWADPLTVLHEWDRRRAAAWASGDEAALRRLYLPGSAAGERDVAALREWTERGLRVRQLRMQVLAARVVRRGDGSLVLRVTDRVAGATAVGRGQRVRLPADSASSRVLRLVRRHGRWLVASVREAR